MSWHVILKDHVIKGSYDFMGCSPSWKVTTGPSLVAIDIVVVEILPLQSTITIHLCKTCLESTRHIKLITPILALKAETDSSKKYSREGEELLERYLQRVSRNTQTQKRSLLQKFLR